MAKLIILHIHHSNIDNASFNAIKFILSHIY